VAFRLTIDTGNAAFEGDDAGHELARILRNLAAKLEANGPPAKRGDPWPLYDVNGNRVGEAR
jgi:hypothetical protein